MGGGSLKWGPRSSKETWIIVFCPIVSGFVGLSGFMLYPLKWVCGSGVVVSAKKFLSKNVKFDVFEMEVTTTFSLGNQRKVYLFVNLSLLYIKYII